MAEAASGAVLSGAEKEKVWPGRVGADGPEPRPGLRSQLGSLCFAAAGEASVAEEGVQRDRQPAAGERGGPGRGAGRRCAGPSRAPPPCCIPSGRGEPSGPRATAGRRRRKELGGPGLRRPREAPQVGPGAAARSFLPAARNSAPIVKLQSAAAAICFSPHWVLSDPCCSITVFRSCQS